MGKFVSRGDVVVVKPNIGWDRMPIHAANTNPDVVAAVIRLAFDAGAKKVVVADGSCNDPNRCFQRSGIWRAAYDARRRGRPPAGAPLPHDAPQGRRARRVARLHDARRRRQGHQRPRRQAPQPRQVHGGDEELVRRPRRPPKPAAPEHRRLDRRSRDLHAAHARRRRRLARAHAQRPAGRQHRRRAGHAHRHRLGRPGRRRRLRLHAHRPEAARTCRTSRWARSAASARCAGRASGCRRSDAWLRRSHRSTQESGSTVIAEAAAPATPRTRRRADSVEDGQRRIVRAHRRHRVGAATPRPLDRVAPHARACARDRSRPRLAPARPRAAPAPAPALAPRSRQPKPQDRSSPAAASPRAASPSSSSGRGASRRSASSPSSCTSSSRPASAAASPRAPTRRSACRCRSRASCSPTPSSPR